jgi:hypothetical protein
MLEKIKYGDLVKMPTKKPIYYQENIWFFAKNPELVDIVFVILPDPEYGDSYDEPISRGTVMLRPIMEEEVNEFSSKKIFHIDEVIKWFKP